MRYVSSHLKCCALLVCVLFAAPTVAKGFPTFPTYRTVYPQVAADFNGDGKVDLLGFTPCSPDPCATSTISVSLGRGSGFGTSISSATVDAPEVLSVVVGDFNGDHKLDVVFIALVTDPVVAEFIGVALGNGDGTFGPVLTLPIGGSVQGLVLGDLNGDGKLDIVVEVDGPPDEVQIYLGKGDGTFQPPQTSSLEFPCQVVDINGDGKLDVVGAHSIFLGNGDGTFQSPIALSGSPGGCPAIADFDGDGKLDLAVLGGKGILVFFGNGDGTFQPGITFAGGLSPVRLWAADFNGDGKPALFLSDGTIFLNRGKGTFQPSVTYQFPDFSVLADVNRDGRSDVIFGAGRSGRISVALARPDGTFIAPRVYSEPLDSAREVSMAVGDFNGDGRIDLALCGTLATHAVGQLSRLNGKGDGTFGPPLNGLTGGQYSRFIWTADLNHDGNLDVIIASADSINVLLGLGKGKLQAPVNYSAASPTVLAIADFNGDGIPDIAANGSPGQILLGNGDGTFRTGFGLPAGIRVFLARDFNNDGIADLLIPATNGFSIMLGNGDGTFKPAVFYKSQPEGIIVTADFNHDGKLDVAEVSSSPAGIVARIFPGNGDGTMGKPLSSWISLGQPGGVEDVVAADFNGDGNVDLALTITSNRSLAILSGKGNGKFGPASFYVTQGSFGLHSLLAADFDGNGTQDLALLDPIRNAVTILLNEP